MSHLKTLTALLVSLITAATAFSQEPPPEAPPFSGDKQKTIEAPAPLQPSSVFGTDTHKTPVNELSTDEIRILLEEIARYHGSKGRGWQILSLARRVSVIEGYSARVPEFTDKYQKYNEGGLKSENIALTLTYPSSLKPLGNDAIFVVIDGPGTPLPVRAAELYAAAWTEGLVTRFIVGHYANSMAKAGAKVPDLNWARRHFENVVKTGLPAAFSDAASYKIAADKPEMAFEPAIQKLMADNSIESIGMMDGWAFGCEMLTLPAKDNSIRDAVVKLIRNRFTPREMGQMTGYCLSYLTGFSRILAVRTATDKIAEPIRDPAVILQQIASDGRDSLTPLFADLFMGEFAALVASDALPTDEKASIIRNRFDFISGYNAGTSLAADAMFTQVFGKAFELGYLNGFKVGYERGYATGVADGYASGQKAAWAEANVMINALRAELASVRQELDQARAQLAEQKRSWFDELIDGAGKVVGIAATVIGLF